MIKEKIIQILSEQYDVDAANLSAESTFEDMSFDSLDVAEIVMTLEDEFKISIEMSSDIKTIGDLEKHIQSKIDAESKK
ncbi:MAG TPA: acyl carrier protein [Clostridiales bacterium]|nr:phosphopantetheine-binding protein [Eubacteriales bacterium]HBR31304.1 acyl carrier protein [Clostridiales bacterium]